MPQSVRGRKRTAFVTTLATLIGLYVLTLFVAPAQIVSVGVTIVLSIVGNAATYIGGEVAQAWQRSKYFRDELDGR